MKGPRFAEETFPMKEISEISSQEKNVRQGHLANLHIWWARRPLTSSRAMIYCTLIPSRKKNEEIRAKKEFIIKLSKLENSFDRTLLERATKEILDANGGNHPKVLDPFAGGGSIPLETLRLGCETFASDYNPVATLILKCALEFPQLYGKRQTNSKTGLISDDANQLLQDVKKWADWVLKQAKIELTRFYPETNGEIPLSYIWARTIHCQNPICNAEIPLIRQYWLSKKNERIICLYPYVKDRKILFRLVGGEHGPIPPAFDPNKGTISKAVVTCLACGSVVDHKTTSNLFAVGKSSQRILVVVSHKTGTKGKNYRLSSDNDDKIFHEAEQQLVHKRRYLLNEYGIDPVPDEPLPPIGTLGFRVQRYNMKQWGDLFNARQKLALVTFTEKVRLAYDNMIASGYKDDYAKILVTYLGLLVSKMTEWTSVLTTWIPQVQCPGHTFVRQVLQMVWDYCETIPITGSSGSWESLSKVMAAALQSCFVSELVPNISQGSATSLQYPDKFFDAVITDPPYYDNVPYSYLSDYFYVWLKRCIAHIYPELFSTPLSPKSKEIVAYPNTNGSSSSGKKFFEDMLKKSFQEISRVLKPNGIAVIVYAHKSTAGWETLINSLLDSGLVVTAAWPINTERNKRLRAVESAALASSIYMVAGKYEKKSIGFYKDIKIDLRRHLDNELDKLWKEGVLGADFFISAIGSSIEVFGMYEKIIDDEGTEIRADKLLEQVRRMVTDYAVKQVLHNGFFEEITQMTRLYVLWRWAYGDGKILFDDARKLAQSVGIDLTNSWNKGFIQKDKEFIRILGPSNRNCKDLVHSRELIDVLHRVLLLWNKGDAREIVKVLEDSQFGRSDVFYRIAQAISESLPNESKEKKWIEGFLAGKSRISRELKVESGQRRLFE